MLRDHKAALFFIGKYVAVYLILNTLYAWYIDHHAPDADPFTIIVSDHVTTLLSVSDPTVRYAILAGNPNVPVFKGERAVVEVFEGCNSVNVMVVFVSFLIAFRGPAKATVIYAVVGAALIYLFNLLRVVGLYGVALHYPESLYFFHKFFFTGILYGIVFLVWYFWVKQVSRWKTAVV